MTNEKTGTTALMIPAGCGLPARHLRLGSRAGSTQDSRRRAFRALMASGLLALTAVSCREAPGLGWNSIVTSTASETFLLRYVPAPGMYDDAGPRYVFEIPAGARGLGLAEGGWHGSLEVLRPDCSVVGSIELGGSNAETFVEEGGRPRAATGADDLPPTDAHFRPLGDTCGSPRSADLGPSY